MKCAFFLALAALWVMPSPAQTSGSSSSPKAQRASPDHPAATQKLIVTVTDENGVAVASARVQLPSMELFGTHGKRGAKALFSILKRPPVSPEEIRQRDRLHHGHFAMKSRCGTMHCCSSVPQPHINS